jgi:hypothetical protein
MRPRRCRSSRRADRPQVSYLRNAIPA